MAVPRGRGCCGRGCFRGDVSAASTFQTYRLCAVVSFGLRSNHGPFEMMDLIFLLEVLGVAYRVAFVLVDGVQVVVGWVTIRGGAVGAGTGHVRRDLTDERRGVAGDVVGLVAVDGLAPAHRAAVEDARAALVGVIGGVA